MFSVNWQTANWHTLLSLPTRTEPTFVAYQMLCTVALEVACHASAVTPVVVTYHVSFQCRRRIAYHSSAVTYHSSAVAVLSLFEMLCM